MRRKIMAEYPKHIIIDFIGVLPHVQGKGVGTCPVKHLLEKADQSHYSAYVQATDYQTVNFFERLGFASQGQIALSSDRMYTLTPMVHKPAMDDPSAFQVRPEIRDSDKST